VAKAVLDKRYFRERDMLEFPRIVFQNYQNYNCENIGRMLEKLQVLF